ncbi:MAG: hypothetical protein RL071_2475, partial [Pseudomonadota bacterium]
NAALGGGSTRARPPSGLATLLGALGRAAPKEAPRPPAATLVERLHHNGLAFLALEIGSISENPTQLRRLWSQAWNTPQGGFQALLGDNLGLNGPLATAFRARPSLREGVVTVLQGPASPTPDQACKDVLQLGWQLVDQLGEAYINARLRATPWVRFKDNFVQVATADQPTRWQRLN